MVEVNFDYNVDKDVENFIIAKTAVGSKDNPSKRQIQYENIYGSTIDKEKIKKFIIDFLEERKIDTTEIIKKIEKEWAPVNNEFFQRAETIFKIKLPVQTVTAFLTINDRCGYSPEQYYFFLNLLTRSPKKICAHEIFHFFFHYRFEKKLKKEVGLTPQEFYDLKESFNEILNLEFFDLLDAKDNPNTDFQIPIRQKIVTLWQKNPDIEIVLQEMVKDKIKLIDFS